MIRLGNAIRRGLSRRLVRAARDPERRPDMSLGELIRGLGDRSFGWCIVLFALISMLPMPIGSNMITAIPLILLTGQMALGLPQVWLPDWVTMPLTSSSGDASARRIATASSCPGSVSMMMGRGVVISIWLSGVGQRRDRRHMRG